MKAKILIDKEDVFELIAKKLKEKNPNLSIVSIEEDVNWADEYFEGIKVVIELAELN